MSIPIEAVYSHIKYRFLREIPNICGVTFRSPHPPRYEQYDSMDLCDLALVATIEGQMHLCIEGAVVLNKQDPNYQDSFVIEIPFPLTVESVNRTIDQVVKDYKQHIKDA